MAIMRINKKLSSCQVLKIDFGFTVVQLFLMKIFALWLVQVCHTSNCAIKGLYGNLPTDLLKNIYWLEKAKAFNEPKLPFDATLQDRVFGSFQCGKPATDVANAIVNGNDAPEKAWPWQAALEMSVNAHVFCGGALISKTWVLTAAHCILANNFTVKLGGKKQGTNIQTFHVKNIILHRDYNNVTNEDDMALLKLNKDVIFNDHVKPICLPRYGSRLESDEFCFVTGFGKLNFSFLRPSETLHQIKVNIMHPSLCSYTLKIRLPFLHGDRRILCLDLNDYNQAICQGDSGGPLSCKVDGWFQLVGINSATIDNCSATLSGGQMMRVSEYIDWIVTNVAEADH